MAWPGRPAFALGVWVAFLKQPAALPGRAPPKNYKLEGLYLALALAFALIYLFFLFFTRLKYVYLVNTREYLTVLSITQDYMSEFQAT
jgi:hypothetical protein